jgi:hypothetical protein
MRRAEPSERAEPSRRRWWRRSDLAENSTPDRGTHLRDSGFGLVDIVCAVSLMGIVVIPMIDSVFTAVSASSTAREVAEIETVLQNAADRVNRAPTGCEYDVYVQAAALSKGWEASQTSATYHYYVPGASARASDAGTWADGGCPGGVRTPGLIQLVTVTIRSESGLITRSIKVVKSDV